MWILIFWLSTPFSGSSRADRSLSEFGSERACKDTLTAMKKVNVGELTLRGVCVSKLLNVLFQYRAVQRAAGFQPCPSRYLSVQAVVRWS